MRVQRLRNRELLAELITKPRLWETITEDEFGDIKDYTAPDLDRIVAMAMLEDDELHGFILGRPMTPSIVETHVVIDPDKWGHEANVPLAHLALDELFRETGAAKFVACIPVTDAQVLRYAQRAGFKREGVNKQSFLRKGELLDQYYVGLTRESRGLDE